MLFTFQPALWTLQQPHKHSPSLQLATHTQLAHHYIEYALWTLSAFLSLCRARQGWMVYTKTMYQCKKGIPSVPTATIQIQGMTWRRQPGGLCWIFTMHIWSTEFYSGTCPSWRLHVMTNHVGITACAMKAPHSSIESRCSVWVLLMGSKCGNMGSWSGFKF